MYWASDLGEACSASTSMKGETPYNAGVAVRTRHRPLHEDPGQGCQRRAGFLEDASGSDSRSERRRLRPRDGSWNVAPGRKIERTYRTSACTRAIYARSGQEAADCDGAGNSTSTRSLSSRPSRSSRRQKQTRGCRYELLRPSIAFTGRLSIGHRLGMAELANLCTRRGTCPFRVLRRFKRDHSCDKAF